MGGAIGGKTAASTLLIGDAVGGLRRNQRAGQFLDLRQTAVRDAAIQQTQELEYYRSLQNHDREALIWESQDAWRTGKHVDRKFHGRKAQLIL